MNTWRTRLATYTAEIKLCFLMGSDLSSRIRLALDTCLFHLSNGFSVRRSYQSKAHTYRITVGKQTIPLRLRQLGGDFFVFHEIFLGEAYRLPTWFQPKPVVIVDLGANIGLTTLYYSRRFPDAQFICIEPSTKNLPLLRANLAAFESKAIILEGAASHYTGVTHFANDEASWGGQITQDETKSVPVPCYSMSDILAYAGGNPISLLKIDIEGAEEAIFAAPCPWLAPVNMIVIELHSDLGATNFRRAVREAGFHVLEPDPIQGTHMLIAYRA